MEKFVLSAQLQDSRSSVRSLDAQMLETRLICLRDGDRYIYPDVYTQRLEIQDVHGQMKPCLYVDCRVVSTCPQKYTRYYRQPARATESKFKIQHIQPHESPTSEARTGLWGSGLKERNLYSAFRLLHRTPSWLTGPTRRRPRCRWPIRSTCLGGASPHWRSRSSPPRPSSA